MLLKDKTSIITGCNRGIGLSILETFAQNGANVFACYRKKNDKIIDNCKNLSKKFGVKIYPVFFDLRNKDELKNAFQEILNNAENIDILVNNAGIIHTSLFQMTKIESYREIFEINFFSYIDFTQKISKLMTRKKNGSIINISSSAAHEANIGRSAYASSKSSIETLSKVISRELGRFNVRVNSIAPGLTNTDMMKESTPNQFLKDTLNRISLNRVADPIEIANVALFLASDLSSYVTGQTIRVDGGM
ncbi:SDR family oxidoreductase [Candidatus Pelagibacter sp.]|nr:SDR family oxidoreductase [Candidatus Pelagibacter sp.]